MSGFLQRLATHAAHPTGNVHPFTGTRFQAREVDAARSVAPIATSEEKSRAEEPRGETPLPRRLATIETPLIPSPEVSDSQASGSDPANNADAPDYDMIAPPRLPVAPPSRFAREQSALDLEKIVKQLLVRPETREESKSQVEPVTAATPANDRPGRYEINRLPSSKESTPRSIEEIQINIGRIEVTAVHPPAAPSVPTAARPKAVGLLDYLNRHNGRAQ